MTYFLIITAIIIVVLLARVVKNQQVLLAIETAKAQSADKQIVEFVNHGYKDVELSDEELGKIQEAQNELLS